MAKSSRRKTWEDSSWALLSYSSSPQVVNKEVVDPKLNGGSINVAHPLYMGRLFYKTHQNFAHFIVSAHYHHAWRGHHVQMGKASNMRVLNPQGILFFSQYKFKSSTP